MTNLERLKLELSNKEYYTDDEYTVFLEENNLISADTYDKSNNQIKLLETVISVLETFANDVDLMRKIDSKDISTVEQAYEWLSNRIDKLKEKVFKLKINEEENGYKSIRPLIF